jgi:hypothetical protein
MSKLKLLTLILGVLLIIFLAGHLVLAWVEPSQAPPGGNVEAPINVGSTPQTKTANLRIMPGELQAEIFRDADVGGTWYIDLSNAGTAGVFQGSVGIGINPPGYKLDVNGTVNMTGFRMTTGAALNRVLTSDASGVGTWQAATGGMNNPMTTLGDIIYGGASGTPTRLPGSAGFLKSTGAAAPSWSAVGLATADTTGILTVAKGGTGNDWSTVAQGSMPYFSAVGTMLTFGPGTSGQFLKSNGAAAAPSWAAAAGGGYTTIQNQGTSLTQRNTLNFTGAGVTCVDNAGSTRTDCTIPGGGGAGYWILSDPLLYPSSTTYAVGIGTQNPTAKLHVVGNPTFARHSNDSSSPAFAIIKSRGTEIAPTIVSNGDFTGVIYFRGYDGLAYMMAAGIGSNVDGTPGLNDMPGRLTFLTTSDGSATSTERMRITSTGNVGIGTTTPLMKLDVRDTSTESLWVRNGTTYFFAGADNTNKRARIGAYEEAVGWKDLIINEGGGNVGIGTTSAGYKLDVNGDPAIATPYLKSPSAGDITKDGDVNSYDLRLVSELYNCDSTKACWTQIIGADNLGNYLRGRDADLNKDNIVDIQDINTVANNFKPIVTPYSRAPKSGDINKDGLINSEDLTLCAISFGCISGAACWDEIISIDNLGNYLRGRDADLNKDNIVDIQDLSIIAGSLEYRPYYYLITKKVDTTFPAIKMDGDAIVTAEGYLQIQKTSAGAPAAADCQGDGQRGRFIIDTVNNRLYICMGAARGWDYVSLTN